MEMKYQYTHTACAWCLELQHAQDALANPGTCARCSRLSLGFHPLQQVEPRGIAISTGPNWAEEVDAAVHLFDLDKLDTGLGPLMISSLSISDSGDEPIRLPSEEDEAN